MLNSMTPEQRAQLQGLAEQLLEDMDLRWQVDQLGEHLQQLFPQMGWDRALQLPGPGPARLRRGRVELDAAARRHRPAREPAARRDQPGALAEADIDRARELLGDDAARCLERLAELAKMLEEAGLIENKEGRYELTPKGIRKIGSNALSRPVHEAGQGQDGPPPARTRGVGHERAYETKPYEFGDPFNLDIHRTIRNAIRRTGGGTPVRLIARRLRDRAHRERRPSRRRC